MRYFALLLIIVFTFGCGTDFYLNREPIRQLITLSQGGETLQLEGKSLIDDNVVRTRMSSEFYGGSAQIVFENGSYKMDFSKLPLDKDKTGYLKGDLYAAFFAGDYPFHADNKMFGETTFENRIKIVKDTDGYELYKVIYNGNSIRLHNIVREYDILIESEKPIQPERSN